MIHDMIFTQKDKMNVKLLNIKTYIWTDEDSE